MSINTCYNDSNNNIFGLLFRHKWYYMRLTTFHSQFRAIGTNYNQITKAIKATFTEKKALAFLFKLEKATLELVALQQKIVALTEEFKTKFSNLKFNS